VLREAKVLQVKLPVFLILETLSKPSYNPHEPGAGSSIADDFTSITYHVAAAIPGVTEKIT
jgi:hypothetical protein